MAERGTRWWTNPRNPWLLLFLAVSELFFNDSGKSFADELSHLVVTVIHNTDDDVGANDVHDDDDVFHLVVAVHPQLGSNLT